MKQETQLSLTNRATRLEVSQGHHNGTIPHVRYRFLLVCYSNFVSKTRQFFVYLTSKMSWPRNPGQKSLKVIEMVPFDRLVWFLLVFYRNFVPNTHCFRDIWLQKCRNFENQVRGPSRSLEMSPFDRAHMTYLKTRVRVTQGHRNRHRSIRHLWFPINVP